MTREQYVDNSTANLELWFRSCIAQLRNPSDKATFVSHMIRLCDESPNVREQFRDKLNNLMGESNESSS